MMACTEQRRAVLSGSSGAGFPVLEASHSLAVTMTEKEQ